MKEYPWQPHTLLHTFIMRHNMHHFQHFRLPCNFPIALNYFHRRGMAGKLEESNSEEWSVVCCVWTATFSYFILSVCSGSGSRGCIREHHAKLPFRSTILVHVVEGNVTTLRYFLLRRFLQGLFSRKTWIVWLTQRSFLLKTAFLRRNWLIGLFV